MQTPKQNICRIGFSQIETKSFKYLIKVHKSAYINDVDISVVSFNSLLRMPNLIQAYGPVPEEFKMYDSIGYRTSDFRQKQNDATFSLYLNENLF